VLPRFAADFHMLKKAGHLVERFNLAQQPQAFIENVDLSRIGFQPVIVLQPVSFLQDISGWKPN